MSIIFRRQYLRLVALVLKNLEFVKYIFTGALNTVIGAIIFYVFLFCGLEYWLAGICALSISIINNFFTYRTLVFTKAIKSHFLRYCALHLTLYFANLSMRNYLSTFGIQDAWIYLILLPPTAISGFLFSRFFVFKNDIVIPGK